MSASKESSQHERKGKTSHEQKSHKKLEKMRPAKPRWQQGWTAGLLAARQTTRKEFSGKKITFPCLMSSRQVDDVPPRAEADIVDGQNSRLNPKPETHSPGMAKTAGERSNALSPRREGRLQTRKTINHRRMKRRMSRMNRRNRTRTNRTPTRIPTRIRRMATSRRRRANSRAGVRAPAPRPRTRRPTAKYRP